MTFIKQLVLAATLAVAALPLAAPAANAQIVINSGTYTGANGGDSSGGPGGSGQAAYSFSSGTLIINGGTFTGGRGGNGGSTFSMFTGIQGFSGGGGGSSLSLSGGTTTINGGTFQGGNGGSAGYTNAFPGVGGTAVGASGSQTVVNVYGGTFATGTGSLFVTPPAFSASSGAIINFFADPGTFSYSGGRVSGSFGGTTFNYAASTGGGGTIQAGAVAVPEAGSLALVLPALGVLGAVVIRRRK